MAADEQKRLQLRRSLEKAERQRRASPLDDDNVDESRDSKDDDKDLKVLKRALD